MVVEYNPNPSREELEQKLAEAEDRLRQANTEAADHIRTAHGGRPHKTCHTCINKTNNIVTTKGLIDYLKNRIKNTK